MDEGNEKLKELVQNLIQSMYSGNTDKIFTYYSEEIEWVVTDYSIPRLVQKYEIEEYIRYLSKMKVQIMHIAYEIVVQNEQIKIITGSFYTINKERILHNITICFERVKESWSIKYLHLSSWHPQSIEHWVKGVDERFYLINETKLIYLEARHNHIVWHCQDKVVESVGLLKNVQDQLSNGFIRIHKGYIIHTKHVRKIGRCFVIMDNGENIVIPEKKYVEIRQRIMESV